MADVFISYSKQDPEPTRKLAHELETLGYSVWWDTNLLAGANFREVIVKQLEGAKAVIVIWTPSSVKSDWVISEADRARAARKLVPLRVPALGPQTIPMPFDTLHTEVVGDIGRLVQSLTVLGVAPSGRAPASLPSAVPRSAADFYYRGNTYFNNGDPGRAIADYNKAIELNPKFAGSYYNRGNAWHTKGDQDRAIADLSKAIELNPKFAGSYYIRGLAWHTKGDQDRAIADLSKAIDLNPKSAGSYYNRGHAWRAKGDQDRAIADYSKAIELNPKLASAYYNRGLAFKATGRREASIADFRRALSEDASHQPSKDALKIWGVPV
jgi:Tfp pilus assembly protein PilF